jgi:hypothetical protein
MEQRERCKGNVKNFIKIIKGKSEETTPKAKTKTTLEMKDEEKWEVKINNQSVYGGTENVIR